MDKKEFLPGDQESAQREIECIEFLKERADTLLKNGHYIEASAYHINIARSLRELDILRQAKLDHDQEMLLKRMDAQLVVDKQIHDLKGRVYAKSR